MEDGSQLCPSPSPNIPSSSSSSSSSSSASASVSLLKDISNFKTPKRPSQPSKFTSPCPQFFTASKQTPAGSTIPAAVKDIRTNFKTPKRPSQTTKFTSPCPRFFTASKQTPGSTTTSRRARPSLAPSTSRHKTATARKIKAFELEQSQSSRKVLIKKEQSLKSLSKSLTVWLNFLFENPSSCGCDLTVGCDRNAGKGKREGGIGGEFEVGVDVVWRNPKRQRDLKWRGDDAGSIERFSNPIYLPLKNSLKDVCSFDDLTERMQVYLSLRGCKEILDAMTRVTKV